MRMKKSSLLIIAMFMMLSGCSFDRDENSNESKKTGEYDNYIGEYQHFFIDEFAQVVQNGTKRNQTGNVFRYATATGIPEEVPPGHTYKPYGLPASLPKGYTIEVKLEEVNRHAENPSIIQEFTTEKINKAAVKIPDTIGKLYRYTIVIRNDKGEFRDIRYEPLFTTFDDYNMAINVSKSTYKKGEPITVLVENWGPNYISYATDWKVFKQSGEKWKKVKLPEKGPVPERGKGDRESTSHIFLNDEDSTIIKPGDHRQVVLPNLKLSKGKYLIQGTLGTSRTTFTLEDHFEVK